MTTKKQAGKDFGIRLKEAFGGARGTEIAQKLGISDASVSAYLSGDSFPSLDNLKKISELTKCSLHWLLTGEGEASTDPLRSIEPGLRVIVEKLAADEKKPIDEVLARLLTEALVARGSQLFALYPTLRERELDQLRLIFQEFYGAEPELSTKTAVPSKRQAS